jgi:hypothetical protein
MEHTGACLARVARTARVRACVRARDQRAATVLPNVELLVIKFSFQTGQVSVNCRLRMRVR